MANNESFADMFEQESTPVGKASPIALGDEVEGTVVHVGAEAIFVQLGEKRQGYFSTMDLPASAEIEVGQLLRGFVIDNSGDEIRLGLGFGKNAGSGQLVTALESGIPVEGKVTGFNKGGLSVEVAGARAFCPASQVEDRFVEDLSPYVGRTMRFIVTEIKERDAVLSRRRLLAAEKAEASKALVSRLAVGAVMSGRVTQIRDFGAFVDLGGLDGLLPRAELSHDRVAPGDVVSVGDVVEVKILALEDRDDKTRITLSLKALSSDPWDGVSVIAPLGRVVAGRVTRHAEFGVFVRLAEGIEGLLHVSELGGNQGADEAYPAGDQVMVVVKSVDKQRRRIALVPAPPGAELGAAGLSTGPVVGAVIDAKVESVEHFGVFVQVDGLPGRVGRGLIPMAELGVERGVDLRKHFTGGTAVRAKVLETGEGRLRLSIKAAVADIERAEFDGYRDKHGPPKSMGTFGDLLKKKLGG